MVEKRVMKRRTRPVEDDEDEVPQRATGPSKKAAPSKRAPTRAAAPARSSRVQDDDDDADEHELRAGWTASQEMIDQTSPWAATFVPSTEVQIVKFIPWLSADGELQSGPYATYARHWIQRVGTGRRPYTCLESWGRPCPLCGVGDRASAVTAFNVAVVGDDGGATHKSWDASVKPTQQLKTFNKDLKIGPLIKPTLYFGVSVPETSQRQQKQTIILPIRARDLFEDYRIHPLEEAEIERLTRKAYTQDIVQRPLLKDLQDVADELTGEDVTPDWSS